jgi:hypothetical protein
MFWSCCAKIDVIEPKKVVAPEKISVNVPVVSKPITLISRAPPVEQSFVIVPVKKEKEEVKENEVKEVKEVISKDNALCALIVMSLLLSSAYVINYSIYEFEFEIPEFDIPMLDYPLNHSLYRDL